MISSPGRTETKAWRILTTLALSGQENMDFDRETLRQVELGQAPPTLRFFLFKEPTATFGRLQKQSSFALKVPAGIPLVQRPTGGGLVLHGQDLCLSLCWTNGQAPIPTAIREQYQWIHTVIQQALQNMLPLDMATCRDCAAPEQAFDVRECFTQPVGYDLLQNKIKIVGGALYHTRSATLYQGSIQHAKPAALIPLLEKAFRIAFV